MMVVLVIALIALAARVARLVRQRPAAQAGKARAGCRRGTGRALEAARAAKYAEIRDTELDYRTGKLSRRTSARSTASCAPRRSRSFARSTSCASLYAHAGALLNHAGSDLRRPDLSDPDAFRPRKRASPGAFAWAPGVGPLAADHSSSATSKPLDDPVRAAVRGEHDPAAEASVGGGG